MPFAESSLPLVSICVPTYNGTKFVEATLRSIVDQTYKPMEIVLIDDRSTDNTFELARNFLNEVEGVNTVIKANLVTKGMAGNWNEVIKQAHGKFIKIMGQDDLLEPECIEKQVQCLEKNKELAMVACSRKLIRPNGKLIFTRILFKNSQILDGKYLIRRCLDFGGNFIGEPVSVLARKEAFQLEGGYDRRLSYFIDVDMWIKIMKTGYVYYQTQPLCSFRVHKGSVTFNIRKKVYGELELLREIYPELYTPSFTYFGKLFQRLRWEFFVMARTLVYAYFGIR